MTVIINVRARGDDAEFIASSQGIVSRSSKSVLEAVRKTALKRKLMMRVPSLNYFEGANITITPVTRFTFLAEWPDDHGAKESPNDKLRDAAP